MLNEMTTAGAIARVEKEGRQYFHAVPWSSGCTSTSWAGSIPSSWRTSDAYMSDRSFGLSLLSTEVPQMRTIPVEKSLSVEHAVTNYDALVERPERFRGAFRRR